jgi:hypothetical protein
MRREEFQEETLREQAIFLAAALAIAPLRSNAADLVVWCEKGFYRGGRGDCGKHYGIRAEERQPRRARPAIGKCNDSPAHTALLAGQPPTSCSDSGPPPANMANVRYEDRLQILPFASLFEPDALGFPPCAMRRRVGAPSSRRAAPRGRDAGIDAAEAALPVGARPRRRPASARRKWDRSPPQGAVSVATLGPHSGTPSVIE